MEQLSHTRDYSVFTNRQLDGLAGDCVPNEGGSHSNETPISRTGAPDS